MKIIIGIVWIKKKEKSKKIKNNKKKKCIDNILPHDINYKKLKKRNTQILPINTVIGANIFNNIRTKEKHRSSLSSLARNANHIKYKNILEYNDDELNNLLYEKALIHDKRTFIQYYISLLRINNLLIFSFYCNKKDYNSQIIKAFLFFFHFAVHLTINAVFFGDNTLHKILIDEGDFNFIYQLPQIIYSFLISTIINLFIKYLSLSEKNIIEIKQEKVIKDLNEKVKTLFNTLKNKFTLFFIVAFLLLLFFMYYITCFCCIYEHTQIQLIEDSFISFG